MTAIEAHARWCEARQQALLADESWLGLIGLIWLETGDNTVGSAGDCHVVLPAGPALAGTLRVEGLSVAWQQAATDDWQPLATDRAGDADKVQLGQFVFFVIERDGRLAVRLRDLAWRHQRRVPPLSFFAYDPAWRIEADWETLSHPLSIEAPNVAGDLRRIEINQRASFTIMGRQLSLLPMSIADDGVFFVFRDQGSGRDTYGAGRFLKTPPATVDGKIVLDFNFAYSPPCAFTPFATCPLPPAENWLPLAIPAGERKWSA